MFMKIDSRKNPKLERSSPDKQVAHKNSGWCYFQPPLDAGARCSRYELSDDRLAPQILSRRSGLGRWARSGCGLRRLAFLRLRQAGEQIGRRLRRAKVDEHRR